MMDISTLTILVFFAGFGGGAAFRLWLEGLEKADVIEEEAEQRDAKLQQVWSSARVRHARLHQLPNLPREWQKEHLN